MLENQIFFYFANLQYFIFLISVESVKILSILNSIFKFFRKRYSFINFFISLALILIRIRPDTKPDQQHCLHPIETAMVFSNIGFLYIYM
jgi:hypothetical protein